jgi:hypothetical protein
VVFCVEIPSATEQRSVWLLGRYISACIANGETRRRNGGHAVEPVTREVERRRRRFVHTCEEECLVIGFQATGSTARASVCSRKHDTTYDIVVGNKLAIVVDCPEKNDVAPPSKKHSETATP